LLDVYLYMAHGYKKKAATFPLRERGREGGGGGRERVSKIFYNGTVTAQGWRGAAWGVGLIK